MDIEHCVCGIEHCYAGFVFPIAPPTKDCAALRIFLKLHLFLTLVDSATRGCLCLQWIMSLENLTCLCRLSIPCKTVRNQCFIVIFSQLTVP